MEVADLLPLVERLEDNVDDLEEILQPLLESSLVETSKRLPLLDKAKLHVLVTYTLESLLFSYLRLHGVNAKEHPVFKELTRVKQYFEKIKALETEPEKRTMALDKQAASRFIKHGLAGNDKHDLARAEKEAKEKALAQMKAAMLARKQSVTPQESSKAPTTAASSDSDSSSDPDSTGDDEVEEDDDKEERPTGSNEASFIPLPSEPLKTAKKKSKERRQEARAKKEERKAKQKGKKQQPPGPQKNNQAEVRRQRYLAKRAQKKAHKAREKAKTQAAKERRAAGIAKGKKNDKE